MHWRHAEAWKCWSRSLTARFANHLWRLRDICSRRKQWLLPVRILGEMFNIRTSLNPWHLSLPQSSQPVRKLRPSFLGLTSLPSSLIRLQERVEVVKVPVGNRTRLIPDYYSPPLSGCRSHPSSPPILVQSLPPIGCRLSAFSAEWAKLRADQWVLRTLLEGYRPPPPPILQPYFSHFSGALPESGEKEGPSLSGERNGDKSGNRSRMADSSGVRVDTLPLRSLVDTTPDPSSIIHHHTFTSSTFLIISLFCYCSLFLLHTDISGRQPYGYEMSTLHIYNIYIKNF